MSLTAADLSRSEVTSLTDGAFMYCSAGSLPDEPFQGVNRAG
jgi:hypothetical protein